MIVKMKMGNNALFSSDAAIVRPEFPNQILQGEKLCYNLTSKTKIKKIHDLQQLYHG